MPYPPRVSIRIRSWHGGAIEESTDVEQLERLVGRDSSATWIDITDPDPDEVGAVARRLGLHPLLVEDIVARNERAKVQLIDDVIHVVAFVLERGQTGRRIDALEIDFVLGHGFLLSVHPSSWDPMTAHQLKEIGRASCRERV